MALNIKDPETERLAAEVAELAHETKTGAIRNALKERRDRLKLELGQRAQSLRAFLEEEIWPLVPAEVRGKPVSREEWEDILGYGPGGV